MPYSQRSIDSARRRSYRTSCRERHRQRVAIMAADRGAHRRQADDRPGRHDARDILTLLARLRDRRVMTLVLVTPRPQRSRGSSATTSSS